MWVRLSVGVLYAKTGREQSTCRILPRAAEALTNLALKPKQLPGANYARAEIVESQEQTSSLANAGIALNSGPTGDSSAVIERALWDRSADRVQRSGPEIRIDRRSPGRQVPATLIVQSTV